MYVGLYSGSSCYSACGRHGGGRRAWHCILHRSTKDFSGDAIDWPTCTKCALHSFHGVAQYTLEPTCPQDASAPLRSYVGSATSRRSTSAELPRAGQFCFALPCQWLAIAHTDMTTGAFRSSGAQGVGRAHSVRLIALRIYVRLLYVAMY